MEFAFETRYDQKAMTTMARGLRKTVRRKRSRRSHIVGWLLVLLALLLLFWSNDGGFAIRLELRPIITFIIAIILLIVLIWEDAINGYIARRRLLTGTEKSNTIFNENEFISCTDIGTSTFQYDKIKMIAETTDYFVFIYSINHAQVYDKKSISGGTLEQFRSFIENETKLHILKA